MCKYLKKFITHAEYDTYINSKNAILPNVSICSDEINVVHYNPYVPPQPNDEIWYTTTDGSLTNDIITESPEPSEVPYVGPNIISNTYINGKGIIKFDGPITKLGVVIVDNEPINMYASITDAEGTSKLTSLSFPSSLTEIGGGAIFGTFNNLPEFIIPSSVTGITGLYSIYIINNNILNLTIPASVTVMAPGSTVAFVESCTILPTVPPIITYDGNEPLGIKDDTVIYVPAESVNAYKTTPGWSSYASRIQAIPE